MGAQAEVTERFSVPGANLSCWRFCVKLDQNVFADVKYGTNRLSISSFSFFIQKHLFKKSSAKQNLCVVEYY